MNVICCNLDWGFKDQSLALSLIAGSQSQTNVSLDTETYMLTQQPRLMTPVVQGDLVSKVSCTLEKSIEESGGVTAILFLVAKVIDDIFNLIHVYVVEIF